MTEELQVLHKDGSALGQKVGALNKEVRTAREKLGTTNAHLKDQANLNSMMLQVV